MNVVDQQTPVEAYHLLSAEHAISSIGLRRLKVARFSEANDPFELLGLNCMRRGLRKALGSFREIQSDRIAMLCFSDEWKSPVLWSHYADGHKGICLGFELDPRLGLRGIQRVNYKDDKLRAIDKIVVDDLTTELQELLLVTKFSHWKYERELRAFVELSKMLREHGRYFHPLGEGLRLTEVVLGHLCPVSLLAPIRELTRRMNPGAVVSKARLGFKYFEVKPNERYPPE